MLCATWRRCREASGVVDSSDTPFLRARLRVPPSITDPELSRRFTSSRKVKVRSQRFGLPEFVWTLFLPIAGVTPRICLIRMVESSPRQEETGLSRGALFVVLEVCLYDVRAARLRTAAPDKQETPVPFYYTARP